MILIVGLGNPGTEYRHTPHNMGFEVLDYFKEHSLPRSSWREEFNSSYLDGEIFGQRLILCKPQTFMNNSGSVVAQIVRYHPLALRDLWVIHDDLDLPLGSIRVDIERGGAGHKGVQSIIDALGSNAFWRVRVGIRPEPYPSEAQEIDRYLTARPLNQETRAHLLEHAHTLLTRLLKEGISVQDDTIK